MPDIILPKIAEENAQFSAEDYMSDIQKNAIAEA